MGGGGRWGGCVHVTVRIVFASFRTENRSTLNEKNLLQLGANSFHLE